MLVQCVRPFDPGFDVTPNNCAALAEICARLDGVPLALELAAARLKLFTPGELTFRLRHRMSILVNTGSRRPPAAPDAARGIGVEPRPAQAGERARRVPPALGFRRRFDPRCRRAGVRPRRPGSHHHVAGRQEPAAPAEPADGVAEFAMLQSLREYAAELLVEHGEEETFTVRHTRYFADLAVLAETAIGEAVEAPWMDYVGFEQGNLRKALTHATARRRRRSVVAARLRAGLVRLHPGPGRRWPGNP